MELEPAIVPERWFGIFNASLDVEALENYLVSLSLYTGKNQVERKKENVMQ